MPLNTDSIPANYSIQIAVDGANKPIFARTTMEQFDREVDKVMLNGVIFPWQSLITFDPDVRLV
jgi:hypothetical protein